MSLNANPNYVSTLIALIRVIHLGMEQAARKDKTSLFYQNTILASIKVRLIFSILSHKDSGDIALIKHGGEYVSGYYWMFQRLENGDVSRLGFIDAFGYVLVYQKYR